MKIKVMSDTGDVSFTYPRRAMQLVLKKRATWLDDTTILLKENNMENIQSVVETTIIETEALDTNQTLGAQACEEELQAQTVHNPSEELLMHLANRNVAYKRNLIINIVLLLPGLLAAALVTDMIRGGSWPIGMWLAWAGYTTYRVANLAIPKFFCMLGKFKKVDPIQAEYERLKGLDKVQFATEQNRI